MRYTYVSGPGGDLVPVWEATRAFLHGASPYRVPAFVYPPSVLLLLAPLGLFGFHTARGLFHVVNTGCIVAATALAVHHFHIRWQSAAVPGVVFAVAISGPVRSTLGLENVNGVVLLAEMLTLVLLAKRRDTAAGVAFGVGLAVKPVLAPVLLVLLLGRRFRAVAWAIIVPTALSLVTLPLTSHPAEFFRDVLPFLLKGNYRSNYLINTSIRGAIDILGLPSLLGTALRVIAIAFGGAALLARWRQHDEERVRIAEATGIVLATTFLIFSFSWAYYALYLLPTFVSLADDASSVDGTRLLLVGTALYLVASPDLLPHLASVRETAGLAVLVVSLTPVRSGRVARRGPSKPGRRP